MIQTLIASMTSALGITPEQGHQFMQRAQGVIESLEVMRAEVADMSARIIIIEKVFMEMAHPDTQFINTIENGFDPSKRKENINLSEDQAHA